MEYLHASRSYLFSPVYQFTFLQKPFYIFISFPFYIQHLIYFMLHITYVITYYIIHLTYCILLLTYHTFLLKILPFTKLFKCLCVSPTFCRTIDTLLKSSGSLVLLFVRLSIHWSRAVYC